MLDHDFLNLCRSAVNILDAHFGIQVQFEQSRLEQTSRAWARQSLDFDEIRYPALAAKVILRNNPVGKVRDRTANAQLACVMALLYQKLDPLGAEGSDMVHRAPIALSDQSELRDIEDFLYR